MFRYFFWVFFLIFTGLSFAAQSQAQSSSQSTQSRALLQDARINRYVVAISANDGGKNRPMLRYAESDAKSFANVLKEMGGTQPQNVTLIKQPSVASLQREFNNLDNKISKVKSGGGRNEILVYYSGHADDKGLRLGNETYAWKEFRERIDALNADVKIAVIDACGSGAITRAKGGVAVPAFMVDESSDMKGYAFITSSTQDEASQESDRLRGSFFTHSLVSGLRGAGDASGDGRVTLSEAYQFAFNETLQKTEATMGGAQHPSRDMNLAGTGDVVMTDLNSNGALLDVASDVDGRLFIRSESGELVAELNKKSGHPMSLGLPAGKYGVRLETAMNAKTATIKEANVALVNGKHENLALSNFKDADIEKTVLRGEIGGRSSCNNGDTVACSLDSLDHNGSFRTTFNFYDHEKEPRKGLQIGFFFAKTEDYMLGSQISLFANVAKKEMHGLQMSLFANVVDDHFEGIQLNTTLNYAKSFDGAQISSTVNVASQKSEGVQIAPFLNIMTDSLDGAQIGVFNYAKQTPVQVSVMNFAGSSDVQVSAMNFAGSSGVQVSAMNFAGEENTIQVGAINYARKAGGRQIGVINIAPHADKTPVGLINIVGNGVWTLSGIFNEMGGVGAKLDLGTSYFYTSIETGRNFEDGERYKHFEHVFQNGFGIGTHFGSYGSHFDLEYMLINVTRKLFSTYCVWNEDSNETAYLHRFRLGSTYKLITGIGLTGGVSLNLMTEGYNEDNMLKPLGEYHDDVSVSGHKGRIWPGFYAGLTIGRF